MITVAFLPYKTCVPKVSVLPLYFTRSYSTSAYNILRSSLHLNEFYAPTALSERLETSNFSRRWNAVCFLEMDYSENFYAIDFSRKNDNGRRQDSWPYVYGDILYIDNSVYSRIHRDGNRFHHPWWFPIKSCLPHGRDSGWLEHRLHAFGGQRVTLDALLSMRFAREHLQV